MTLEDSIHSQRLRVLRDAERLGNVSDACRRRVIARETIETLPFVAMIMNLASGNSD